MDRSPGIMKKNYIIDFDSTFTRVEALDELAKISLQDHPDRQAHFDKIEALTNAAMEGKLSFRESLNLRIQLLHANQDHLNILIKKLKKKVSRSFSRNRAFLENHADEILIVSGGFKEFICPVVGSYHIKPEHVYANTFVFDPQGTIIGYNQDNPLSEEGGKVKLLKELKLEVELYGIGDGYSDFQLKESGIIKKFFAFTENIERASVTEKADYVTPNFDEFLYVNHLPRAISYPKNRIACVIYGEIPDISKEILKKEGFNLKYETDLTTAVLKTAGMLLVKDGTVLTAKTLGLAPRLKVIGYLGNSKKKVDREACSALGIVLFDDKKNKKGNVDFIPRRMAAFINNGDTQMSRNFPNLQLPKVKNGHRLIHIHKNVPGVMAYINLVFARNQINIMAQYLMTKGDLGYVITDIGTKYDERLLKELKAIHHTIKFRILY